MDRAVDLPNAVARAQDPPSPEEGIRRGKPQSKSKKPRHLTMVHLPRVLMLLPWHATHTDELWPVICLSWQAQAEPELGESLFATDYCDKRA